MKLIDFEKRGNLIRLYYGDDDCNPEGEDWHKSPYQYNCGRVSDEYIKTIDTIGVCSAIARKEKIFGIAISAKREARRSSERRRRMGQISITLTRDEAIRVLYALDIASCNSADPTERKEYHTLKEHLGAKIDALRSNETAEAIKGVCIKTGGSYDETGIR